MDEIKVRDKQTGNIRTVTRKAYMALGPKVYERLSDEVQVAPEPSVEPVEPQDSGSDSGGETSTQITPAATEETPAPAKKRGRKPKAISSEDAEEK